MSETGRLVDKRFEIIKVFTPSVPLSTSDLFAGRSLELEQIAHTIMEPGRHVIVYGERGVGKTSMANIAATFHWPGHEFRSVKTNCDGSDSFTTVWRRVLEQFEISWSEGQVGLRQGQVVGTVRADQALPNRAGPADVCKVLREVSRSTGALIVLDESDRTTSSLARRALADTVKWLSDEPLDLTLMFVAVADSVDDLIREHESIERALVQILMPRLSADELQEVIAKGAEKLGMGISESAKHSIASLSRGLPHYTHLIAKHAFLSAASNGRSSVTDDDVSEAIRTSMSDVQRSIQTAYHAATYSAHDDAIYDRVLAACALARANDLGWFKASDVSEPLSRIMGRTYDIPGFARHLAAFLRPERSEVLQRQGTAHNFRYRFRNPLMQPYAMLTGIAKGYIKPEWVQRLGSANPRLPNVE